MPLDPNRLTATVMKIRPDAQGQGKLVDLQWWFAPFDVPPPGGPEPERVLMLVDQIGVPARADNDEIRELIKTRKLTLCRTLEFEVSNPEANLALVGEEL